jgi:thiosulfate reductase cytochrome b subunit
MRIYRHSVVVRITHWINVICITGLLMSGLQIFNAHPALYWGEISTFDTPLLAIGGFPSWLTIPSYQSLATGRGWHFMFAWIFVINGLVYLISALVNGHLRRDLVPTREQMRNIGHAIVEHARLRFPKGEESRYYNVLQKLTYLIVVLVLLPLVILAGLGMSPGMDATLPWLVPMLGGRQSARTIHFICANLLVIFAVVHVAMVIVSGLWNNIRSMITGRYDLHE